MWKASEGLILQLNGKGQAHGWLMMQVMMSLFNEKKLAYFPSPGSSNRTRTKSWGVWGLSHGQVIPSFGLAALLL